MFNLNCTNQSGFTVELLDDFQNLNTLSNKYNQRIKKISHEPSYFFEEHICFFH